MINFKKAVSVVVVFSLVLCSCGGSKDRGGGGGSSGGGGGGGGGSDEGVGIGVSELVREVGVTMTENGDVFTRGDFPNGAWVTAGDMYEGCISDSEGLRCTNKYSGTSIRFGDKSIGFRVGDKAMQYANEEQRRCIVGVGEEGCELPFKAECPAGNKRCRVTLAFKGDRLKASYEQKREARRKEENEKAVRAFDYNLIKEDMGGKLVKAGEGLFAGCKGGVGKQECKDAIKGFEDIGGPIIKIYMGGKDKQQKDQENKEDLAKCAKDNTIFGDGGIWGMAGYKMRERVCPLLVRRDENYEERKRELEGVGVALAKVIDKEVPGFRDVLGVILNGPGLGTILKGPILNGLGTIFKGSGFKEENYDNILSYMGVSLDDGIWRYAGGLLSDNVTWGGIGMMLSKKVPAALQWLSNPFNMEETVAESEWLNNIGERIGGTNSTTGRNGFRVGFALTVTNFAGSVTSMGTPLLVSGAYASRGTPGFGWFYKSGHSLPVSIFLTVAPNIILLALISGINAYESVHYSEGELTTRDLILESYKRAVSWTKVLGLLELAIGSADRLRKHIWSGVPPALPDADPTAVAAAGAGRGGDEEIEGFVSEKARRIREGGGDEILLDGVEVGKWQDEESSSEESSSEEEGEEGKEGKVGGDEVHLVSLRVGGGSSSSSSNGGGSEGVGKVTNGYTEVTGAYVCAVAQETLKNAVVEQARARAFNTVMKSDIAQLADNTLGIVQQVTVDIVAAERVSRDDVVVAEGTYSTGNIMKTAAEKEMQVKSTQAFEETEMLLKNAFGTSATMTPEMSKVAQAEVQVTMMKAMETIVATAKKAVSAWLDWATESRKATLDVRGMMIDALDELGAAEAKLAAIRARRRGSDRRRAHRLMSALIRAAVDAGNVMMKLAMKSEKKMWSNAELPVEVVDATVSVSATVDYALLTVTQFVAAVRGSPFVEGVINSELDILKQWAADHAAGHH